MAWKRIRVSLESWMVVLTVVVQKQNLMSLCLKSYGLCHNFFGTKCTHSCIPGLKGEALFSELLSFFVVFANCRLVQIHTYKFALYKFTHINFYVNLFFIQFCM